MRRILIFIAGLLTGSSLGAGISLLFAPASGDDMRKGIRERWQEIKSNSAQAAQDREQALRQELEELTTPKNS